jgi:hypothetical protein
MRLKAESDLPQRLSDELIGPEVVTLLLLWELSQFGCEICQIGQLTGAVHDHSSGEWRLQFMREMWETDVVRRPGESSSSEAWLFCRFQEHVARGWLTHPITPPHYGFTTEGEAVMARLKAEQPELARIARDIAAKAAFDFTEDGWRVLGERMGWTVQAAS